MRAMMNAVSRTNIDLRSMYLFPQIHNTQQGEVTVYNGQADLIF